MFANVLYKTPVVNQRLKPEHFDSGTRGIYQKAAESLAIANDTAPTKTTVYEIPEFSLESLLCVLRTGIKQAGEEIRIIKQTIGENEQGDVSVKASLSRIVGVLKRFWPNVAVSDVRGRVLDGIAPIRAKDSGMKDLTSCKVEDAATMNKDIEIILNPIDSIPQLISNSLHHVTTSACILYKSHPAAGIIYQPFLRRSIWGAIGRKERAEEISLRRGAPAYGAAANHVDEAKKRVGSSAVSPVEGGDDYAVLTLLTNPSVVKSEEGLFSEFFSYRKTGVTSLCAGDAIVRSVGGEIVDLRHKPISYAEKTSTVDGYLIKVDALKKKPIN